MLGKKEVSRANKIQTYKKEHNTTRHKHKHKHKHKHNSIGHCELSIAFNLLLNTTQQTNPYPSDINLEPNNNMKSIISYGKFNMQQNLFKDELSICLFRNINYLVFIWLLFNIMYSIVIKYLVKLITICTRTKIIVDILSISLLLLAKLFLTINCKSTKIISRTIVICSSPLFVLGIIYNMSEIIGRKNKKEIYFVSSLKNNTNTTELELYTYNINKISFDIIILYLLYNFKLFCTTATGLLICLLNPPPHTFSTENESNCGGVALFIYPKSSVAQTVLGLIFILSLFLIQNESESDIYFLRYFIFYRCVLSEVELLNIIS